MLLSVLARARWWSLLSDILRRQHDVSMREQNVSSVWPRPHICVIFSRNIEKMMHLMQYQIWRFLANVLLRALLTKLMVQFFGPPCSVQTVFQRIPVWIARVGSNFQCFLPPAYTRIDNRFQFWQSLWCLVYIAAVKWLLARVLRACKFLTSSSAHQCTLDTCRRDWVSSGSSSSSSCLFPVDDELIDYRTMLHDVSTLRN